MPHDTRDTIVDFVRAWSDKTDIPACRFFPWLAIGASKFHDWKARYGRVNEHNAQVPRDHWLEDWERPVDDARRLVHNYVTYYNEVRLHSAIGYVAPHDRLHGLDGVVQQ